MTRPLLSVSKALVALTVVLALSVAPVAARADLDLKAGSGAAAPKSLIGSPVLGAAIGGLDYSALLGLEIPPSGLNVGFRLNGEVMYGLMDLAPNLRLAIGGRVGWGIHPGDVSGWVLDFVPDVKIKYAINDQFGVYGDGGLGLGFVHESVSYCGGFGFDCSSTSTGLTFQLGGGVIYAMTPNINLLGEVRFDFYTVSGASTWISIPQVGVQFH